MEISMVHQRINQLLMAWLWFKARDYGLGFAADGGRIWAKGYAGILKSEKLCSNTKTRKGMMNA
jgi:hypothetical protein